MVSYWLDLFLQKIFKDFSSCCLLKVKPWTTRPGFEYFLIINLIFPLFFFFFHFKYTVKWRDVNKRVSDKNLLLSKLLGPCSLTLKYLYDFCVVVADLEGVTINLPLWQNSINKDSYFVRFFGSAPLSFFGNWWEKLLSCVATPFVNFQDPPLLQQSW